MEHGEPITMQNFVTDIIVVVVVVVVVVIIIIIIYLFFERTQKLHFHLPFQATHNSLYHFCPSPTPPTHLPTFIWAITWKLAFTKERSLFCLKVLKLLYCD